VGPLQLSFSPGSNPSYATGGKQEIDQQFLIGNRFYMKLRILSPEILFKCRKGLLAHGRTSWTNTLKIHPLKKILYSHGFQKCRISGSKFLSFVQMLMLFTQR